MDRLIARLRRWAASAVLLGALAACATNPVTGRQDLVLVSEAQELALGRQAHQQTLTEYQPLSDPALQQYVDAVGQKLAAVSHRPGLTYTFTALDSPEINAFALPGGYVYITRGLLAYLNSEAELAAVLGHEIGHVTARHGVRQASSAQAAGLGAGLASIFFPELAATGLDQAVGVLGTALLRGYGREHELEADRLGAAYLAQAGYDPQAMFQVIRTLKNHELLDRRVAAAQGREPRAYHGLFATHPDNDTRLKEIIDHVPPAAGGGETARDRFLNQIDGLVFGEDPAGGVFREGRFWHAGLGFVLTPPRGWGGRNLPTRVVFGERSGRAQIQLTLVRREGQETPAALLERVGLGQLIRAAPIDAGGLP
ncbi:MAG: M48 family metalloprotease, partial [Gammaproteobacteria bacterium]